MYRHAVRDDKTANGIVERECQIADFWRNREPVCPSDYHYKEWSHFCIVSDDIDLLVNFSLLDDFDGDLGQVISVPRLTVLVRKAGGIWDGEIDQYSPDQFEISPQRKDIRIAGNSLRLVNGTYNIVAESRNRHLRLELQLRPMVKPVIAKSITLSELGSMRWLVVPKLLATGHIYSCGALSRFSNASAYHDRNWGRFPWGGDFSWEWMSILPNDSGSNWSMVFTRIMDKRRNQALSQSLMIWREHRSVRAFSGSQLEVRHSRLLSQSSIFRLPRIMSIVSDGTAVDIPETVELNCRTGDDVVEIRISFADFAQIAIPSELELKTELLSEVAGSASVKGRLRGDEISLNAHVLAEFKNAAS